MLRLTQILRNLLIRAQGWLDQLFGSTKGIFVWLGNQLKFLSKLLGIGESQYLEDEVQPRQPSIVEPKLPAPTPPVTSTTSNPTRRPDPNMDYFRKLAAQVKTPK